MRDSGSRDAGSNAVEVEFPAGRNYCRGYSLRPFDLPVRGCSSSAKPPDPSGGATEAGLRTLLPRAFAGSKDASAAPADHRELRPPALVLTS